MLPVLFFQTVYRDMKKDLEELNSKPEKDKNVKPKKIETNDEKEKSFQTFLYAISCI